LQISPIPHNLNSKKKPFKEVGYMRKICISLSKGGVGKSSTSVSLAHGLSLAGKKVLLVDTDDQGQDSFLLGVNPEYSLADVLNEDVSVQKALYKARENLWILSGGKALSGIKRTIGRKDFGAEQTLSMALSPLEGQFDFVIVDTAPSWDTLTINALFYCEEVLTPVSLEVLTLNSLVEFSERLKSVQAFNKKLSYKYLLPTFWDRRVKKSSEILEQLKKYYPLLLCDPVKYSVRISESAGFGKTIYEYAPNSSGAQDYEKTVQRILSYA
jgi:chromosome partitioning protein